MADTGLPPLIQALHRPACYDHPVRDIRLVETHISWVLLTGPYAYKIKKPVNLGFLDFSSLEKRRFFCDEELRCNRRPLPCLVEAVVDVDADEAGLAEHLEAESGDLRVVEERPRSVEVVPRRGIGGVGDGNLPARWMYSRLLRSRTGAVALSAAAAWRRLGH